MECRTFFTVVNAPRCPHTVDGRHQCNREEMHISHRCSCGQAQAGLIVPDFPRRRTA